MSNRRKLGIALGGGSARGWAHIGVLRALAEVGIAPDYVAGCSMGAMVGAAFAAGRIEKLETWALSLDWKRIVKLLDVGLRGGLIKGERLLDFFHGQFVECQFNELAIPFATVATDLASGREIWIARHRQSTKDAMQWPDCCPPSAARWRPSEQCRNRRRDRNAQFRGRKPKSPAAIDWHGCIRNTATFQELTDQCSNAEH
jgi:patatin-like phospholipase